MRVPLIATTTLAAGLITKRQADLSGIPPIAQITDNAPTLATPTVPTPTAGTVGNISGAPVLPGAIDRTKYPSPGVVPPTNSTQVQQWLSEIDLSAVPNIPLNSWNAGDPCSDTANAAAITTGGSSGTCWWTCGGCNRDRTTNSSYSDITTCPTKGVWGLTYDDGPSDYTPLILDSLAANNLSATFLVIGSSAYYRPDIVQAEIIAGHHICDHTWSHSVGLTALTNEQIVAELAWAREIIKDLTGLTPLYTRPPWGDTDDRVRAIMKAMDLTPVMWTESPSGIDYDTNDWRILVGTNNGTGALSEFNSYLQMSKSIDTGFITLEHDLYQQEVDVAVGYILPAALASTDPKITVQNVINCIGQPIQNAYKETYLNSTSTTSSASPSSASATGPVGSTAIQSGGATTTGSSTSATSSTTKSSSARLKVSFMGGGSVLVVLAITVLAYQATPFFQSLDP